VKLAAQCDKFLIDEVNLNKSRIGALTDRVNAIETFIRKSDWRPTVLRFSAQGSWAHKTIIKPPGSRGFDADLLVFIQPVNGWTPKDYVLELRRVLGASGTYKDKLTLGNRCVMLEYSGDFSLDIVPCLVDRPPIPQRFEICNRTDDMYEQTDSEAFTAWLDQRNTWVGNDYLREVIRLMKYLRDVKTTFSCKSVLLSTLIGNTVTQADAYYQATNFADRPTALRTLVGRLDDYLQARPKLHKVSNPVLWTEDFVRHWDDDKYENFRAMIHKYRGWIDDAYNASAEAESVRKWRRVFGDQFAPDNQLVLTEVATAIRPVAFPPRFQDAVHAVKLAGRNILANVPFSLPWVQPPAFSAVAPQNRVGVNVKATQHESKNGPAIGPMTSGSIISKRSAILFEAVAPNGAPFGKDYDVQWRVVNTDHDANYAHCLRGGFYPSSKPGRRWETTLYRGVHWVEAFVLRKRDRLCVGASNRFFVVIE
jgi:hypothetical protein